MDNNSPSQPTADTSLGFERVFKHPEGLLTARNLVRLVILHSMEDKHRRGLQASQPLITNSFNISRPLSGLNHAMPDTLKQVLTFSDSHNQMFGSDTTKLSSNSFTTDSPHSAYKSSLLAPQPHETASLCHQQVTMKPAKKQSPKKRQSDSGDEPTKKRSRGDDAAKPKRIPKPKAEKKVLAKHRLDETIWMRILEFTPVQFLGRARLICKDFQSMVDKFTSIYVNCRKENYGYDMPPPPLGLTERQYSNLLGSKGCLEPGCPDKNASRTHWSWAKRWCVTCWRRKIEREDRLIKNRADPLPRTTFIKLLECIPVGMHDSYMKPHDYVDVDDNRPRGAPRLYKYYLTEDVNRIIQRYEELAPAPYHADPNKTAEENAAALARHQEELDGLDEKRANFLTTEKAKIDEHMALVQRIEAGVSQRRERNRTPYDNNRRARRELFTRRAKEDLPHIPEDFVTNTIAFKAAARVFRDGGTERGWQTLKPKIEKEYAERWRTQGNASTNSLPQLDGAADDDAEELGDADFDDMFMDIDRPQSNPNLSSGMKDWKDVNTSQTNPNISNRMSDWKGINASQTNPSLSNGMNDWKDINNSQTNSNLLNRVSDWNHINNSRTNPNLSNRMSDWTHINGSQTIPNLSITMSDWNSRVRQQREAYLERHNVLRWPHAHLPRALPPPSSMTSTATSLNHDYTLLTAHSASLNVGPLFPGVIPATSLPTSHGSTGSSHISISSLLHPVDQ